QVAWRAVIPGDGDPVADIFMGPGRHLVSYPLKDGRRNIVAVEERDAWAEDGWHHEDNPALLRLAFEDFGGPVPGWLKAVDKVWLWGLMDYRVAKTWHDGRMVIMGDAAHPTLPFLAQGANMALEDAWVLARALENHDPLDAMKAYEATRRPRVQKVLAAADRSGANYHMSNPVLRRTAQTVLKIAEGVRRGSALSRYKWLWGHDVTKG
ncbi:MAG: FAD-dependent monooxygenase, partial [Pseudomonadota bacterium]